MIKNEWLTKSIAWSGWRWIIVVAAVLCILLWVIPVMAPDTVLENEELQQNMINDGIAYHAERSDQMTIPLYFRVQGEDYLARETRTLSIPYDRQAAEIILEALVDGPSAGLQDLTSVFVPGTKVLSMRASGNLLTITLTSEFLAQPKDAPLSWEADPNWNREVLLRRRLALQSLVNSVVETSQYTAIQFMVQTSASNDNGTRLHLSDLYPDITGDSLLGPMYRSEQMILTHYNTAELILECWKSRDYQRMYHFVSETAGRPTENSFIQEMNDLTRVLSGYSLSAGTVSADGNAAVLETYLNIFESGNMIVLQSYPLRMECENGMWKITYASLMQMMEAVW